MACTVGIVERVGVQNSTVKEENNNKKHCRKCGKVVELKHRYCWYCGAKLSEEWGDTFEIHSSGESQLPELPTYGRDAQLSWPKQK